MASTSSISQTLISLSLILLLSLHHTAAASPPPVLDTEGNPLQIGVEYYITSAFWGGGGGGLVTDNFINQTCPISLVQLMYDTQYGFPFTLHPSTVGDRVIRESTDVNIRVEAPVACANSTVLRVEDRDRKTGKRFLQIGGELGNYGCGTVRNWFKIELAGPGFYKLVYRPKGCDCCEEEEWEDVGIYKEDRARWVALTSDVPPYLAVFRKVLIGSEFGLIGLN